jgi:hypothetical protein
MLAIIRQHIRHWMIFVFTSMSRHLEEQAMSVVQAAYSAWAISVLSALVICRFRNVAYLAVFFWSVSFRSCWDVAKIRPD